MVSTYPSGPGVRSARVARYGERWARTKASIRRADGGAGGDLGRAQRQAGLSPGPPGRRTRRSRTASVAASAATVISRPASTCQPAVISTARTAPPVAQRADARRGPARRTRRPARARRRGGAGSAPGAAPGRPPGSSLGGPALVVAGFRAGGAAGQPVRGRLPVRRSRAGARGRPRPAAGAGAPAVQRCTPSSSPGTMTSSPAASHSAMDQAARRAPRPPPAPGHRARQQGPGRVPSLPNRSPDIRSPAAEPISSRPSASSVGASASCRPT